MSLRLAFISDLHVDYQMEAVGLVAGRLAELEPDVFVVAGDVSPDPRMLHKTLSLLAEVGPPTLFVPGNHDLWCRSPRHGEAPPQGPDSRELYEEVLPMLASRAGAVFLPAAPWVHGDVGFVGVTGWYDWTFLDEAEEQPFSRVVLEAGRLGSLQWMDGVCSYWTNREGDAISPKKVARAMAMNYLTPKIRSVFQRLRTTMAVLLLGYVRPGTRPRRAVPSSPGSLTMAVLLLGYVRPGTRPRRAVPSSPGRSWCASERLSEWAMSGSWRWKSRRKSGSRNRPWGLSTPSVEKLFLTRWIKL